VPGADLMAHAAVLQVASMSVIDPKRT
jgi:hypothetical protein